MSTVDLVAGGRVVRPVVLTVTITDCGRLDFESPTCRVAPRRLRIAAECQDAPLVVVLQGYIERCFT